MDYQITIDGEISQWGYSKQYVRQMLARYKGKHVDMRISSLGGDLDHGLDIRQQLIEHGDVTVHLTGFVASSATVIAMGAKRICMSKYAFFLVHKCSNFLDAWGLYNADEMAKLIQELEANKRENDKIDVVLAQLYADRCKKKVSDMLDVLKQGGWLNAQEALAWGFIDEITEDEPTGKVNFTEEMKAKFNAYSLPFSQFEIGKADEQPSQSILAQILNAIKTLIAGKQNAETPTDQPTQPTMNETTAYAAVMAAVAAQSLTATADGSVMLTQAQMDALNAALDQANADLAERDATIAERDAAIADLTAKVEAMKNLPAAETAKASPDTEACMTTDQVYDLIKDI